MNTTRTSIVVSSVVLEHIKKNLSDDESISSFFERAAINLLEDSCRDFEVRDLWEAEHNQE